MSRGLGDVYKRQVFVAVVVALLVTTRKALKADLASVLKGE